MNSQDQNIKKIKYRAEKHHHQNKPLVTTLGELVSYSYTKQDLNKFPEVFVWDLDKTYLDTRIESIAGLIEAVLERSWSKKNVPASNTLLKQLQARWVSDRGIGGFPIFFITASPQQMEERIREKLSYDGINPAGCYFKNNLRNLKPSRWWRLKKHIGYKISALLHLRSRLPENIEQVLWGDDSESDAIIYNLYSDICAGRISDAELRWLLKKIGMALDNIDLICDLRKKIPENDPVKKIYINLAVDTDHDYYLKFGRRTVATYNTFQVALDLFQDHRLSLDDVGMVFEEMVNQYGYSKEELVKSFVEFVKRPQLGQKAFNDVLDWFLEKQILSNKEQMKVNPRGEVLWCEKNLRILELSGMSEPWIQTKIDYLNEYR
jgi:hypothetical protein